MSLALVGCGPADDPAPDIEEPDEEPADVPDEEPEDDAVLQVEDGRYRGIYQDRGEEQSR